MDKTRAKVLLSSYRPDSDDANDPVFREALDLLTQDPELATWFQAEQEFDLAMVEKFREVPVDSAAQERIRDALKQAFEGEGQKRKRKGLTGSDPR